MISAVPAKLLLPGVSQRKHWAERGRDSGPGSWIIDPWGKNIPPIFPRLKPRKSPPKEFFFARGTSKLVKTFDRSKKYSLGAKLHHFEVSSLVDEFPPDFQESKNFEEKNDFFAISKFFDDDLLKDLTLRLVNIFSIGQKF